MSLFRSTWRSLNRKNSAVGIAAVVAVATFSAVARPPSGDGLRRLGTLTPTATVHKEPPGVERGQSQPDDAALTKLLVGRWQTSYHGRMTVENRVDGAASMRLEFDFLAAFYYGTVLDLSMTWSVKDRILVYDIQSGSPQNEWKKFSETYGTRFSYKFDEIGEDTLHLFRVIDPDEKFKWVRIE